VRLWPNSADLTIAHRCVGTGRMSELNSFSCDVEHLSKLIHALNRALAVATDCGLLRSKPYPRSATGALRTRARSRAPR
jgi:hypothetical protein